MNSTVIEKIKKLLSLAQSDNANERDAALAKAQRIAVENEVDLALLDLSDVGVVKEEELIEDELAIGKRLEVHKKFVGKIIRDVCRVEILYDQKHVEGTGWTRTISFLGKKTDVEFAKWLYPFLLNEYVRRWNYERKANGLPLGHRNTFFLGVYDGQCRKIADERRITEQETIARHATTNTVAGVNFYEEVGAKRAEYAGKYTLVVQGEARRRRNFLKEKYPHTTNLRSRAVSIRSHDTYSSGTAHGRSIGLNRPLN